MNQRNAKNFSDVQQRVFELTLALYRVTDFFPRDEALRKQLREKANEIFGLLSERIVSGYTDEDIMQVLGKIDVMNAFLDIARTMRFVRPVNIAVLEREYRMVSESFEKELMAFSRNAQEKSKSDVKDISGEYNQTMSDMKKQEKIADLRTWEEFSAQQQKRRDLEAREDFSEQSGHLGHSEAVLRGVEVGSTDNGALNERQKVIITHLEQAEQAKISDFFSFFSGISSKTIQRDLQDLVEKKILNKEGEKRWTVYSINSTADNSSLR